MNKMALCSTLVASAFALVVVACTVTSSDDDGDGGAGGNGTGGENNGGSNNGGTAGTPQGGSGGTGGAGGSAVVTCEDLDLEDACEKCINDTCCTEFEACSADIECVSATVCMEECTDDPETCAQTCGAASDYNVNFNDYYTCMKSCFDPCTVTQ